MQVLKAVASLRPLWFIGVYLGVALIGGALLAPGLWHWVHSPMAYLPQLNFLETHNDFHRYINRCQMLLALALLWPLLKYNAMSNRHAVGLGRSGSEGFQWAGACLMGLCMLGIVAATATLAPHLNWNFQGNWIKHLRNTCIAALLVPVLEEVLFRGAIFGTLRRGMHWRTAAIVASLIFAAAHFLHPRQPNPQPVEWLSGLKMMTHIPDAFSNPGNIPKFISLYLAGFILCCLYQRAGNLYAAMGMHAAWIAGGKTLKFVLASNPASDPSSAAVLLWGRSDFLEGWIVVGVLALIAGYYFYQANQSHVSPRTAVA